MLPERLYRPASRLILRYTSSSNDGGSPTAREKVDIKEFSSRLTELLILVSQGNEITVVMDEKPVARLLPPDHIEKERIPGLHQGEMWMSEDFDEPLPESFWIGDE